MVPPSIVAQHNLRSVICTVGAFAISDLGDGGITFEMASEQIGTAVSGDGRPHFHVINDPRMTVTITLMANSAANKAMWHLWRTQHGAQLAGLPTPPIPFFMTDPLNGDTVSDPFAIIQSVPVPSKAVEEGTAEWVLFLPTAKDSMILAAAQGALPAVPDPANAAGGTFI